MAGAVCSVTQVKLSGNIVLAPVCARPATDLQISLYILSGMAVVMPEPSPESLSEPVAPRWTMRHDSFLASSRI